ncbi:MAG: hypothetical protein A2X86_06230 [Bdellovibrionales bacterium GWA2_49_15]|nr:MAG: hypothetical protein A2X86_06230 [Bdellovibrionales bacterium GWA2_49_15]HAZ14660.1 hypothetical protein [Bdellovibrionales bacterium]
MRLSKYIFCTLLIIPLSFTISCGPMNTESKSDSGVVSSLGQASGPAKVTTGNKFYVSMNLDNTSTTMSTPHEGENNFVIRSVRASNLQPLSADAKVTVFYEMPTMPGMEMDDVATVQPDGSYRVNIVLSMPGLWKIVLTIKDGDLQDQYVIETKI